MPISTQTHFFLKAFGDVPQGLAIDSGTVVEVVLQRISNNIELHFAIPDCWVPQLTPISCTGFVRRDNLWQHNCLELFLGNPASEGYWEYNFSFSGDWNCYRFSSYRQGMAEDPQGCLHRFERLYVDGKWHFSILISVPTTLENLWLAGPSAVLIHPVSQQIFYFASRHMQHRPDFHMREAWQALNELAE